MKSEEHIELQTLQIMITISCQLKSIQRWFTLIQRQWKWVQEMSEDHKWLSWTLFEQVKIEINSRNID